MPVSLLGRSAELDAIDDFLGSVRDGSSGVLLLSGPAGIGKTTIWQAGLDAARGRGFTVVSARPTEVETGLAFAALGDLLGPLLDLPLAPMPEPQQAALDAALLRVPAVSPPHPLGVSLATLHVLRSVDRPVLVAIDDAPWLDDGSARALEFAIRRLRDERVGFLVARRVTDLADALPTWLAAIPPERLHQLDIGSLTVDETGTLLRARLDLSLHRPVLARLHTISGGTPFYALELGRDLQRRGSWDTPDTLETPRTLDRLVGARIASLDRDAEEVALVAAALSAPTVSILVTALGANVAGSGLASAEAAGVLERDGETVRFSHPLLAAAAYARATPDRIRDVHARLATIVADPEQRARHLARTATGPDAAIAAELEAAAAASLRRGASEVAAELAEDAARLTPADASDERARRLVVAADYLLISGDIGRANAILDQVATEPLDGAFLSDVLTRRARVAMYLKEMDRAEELLREAMRHTTDPLRLVRVHELLAGLGHLTWRGWRTARLHMWQALDIARESGDAILHFQMLGHAASWNHALGRPWRHLVAEADGLGVPVDAVPPVEHPDLQFARILSGEGYAAEARVRIGRLIAAARKGGDWTSLPRVLVSAAFIETEAGDWSRAEELAEEARIGLVQTGEGAFGVDLAGIRLWLAVLRGRLDEARETGAAIERRGEEVLKPMVGSRRLALGTLELSVGDAPAALRWAEKIVDQPGLGRLFPVAWESAIALHIEALVGVGRVADARLPASHLERRARRRGPQAAIAEAVRARSVVQAADGDLEAALASADEAVTILGGLDMPFRTARAWFTLGEVRRRARQRGAARDAFETALDGFTQLGAVLWIERTRAELERVAGRRPAGSALTDTERRVAELAGAGQTNKEIADSLFMSVHTVEAHLTRVFRTLGVQSRTELARADLDHSEGGGETQP